MALVIQYLLIFTVLLGCNVAEKDGSILSGPGAPVYQLTVVPPANKSYGIGDALKFKLTFPKPVTVTGDPRLNIDLGGVSRNALYVSGSGGRELLFNYDVVASDNAPTGVTITGTLDLNGGQVTYLVGTTAQAVPTNLIVPSTPGVKVDTTAPVATVVPPLNSLYLKDNFIHFQLQLNESVTVTGIPRLQLTVGSDTKFANYVTGSGTGTLIFRYIVSKTDQDSDGLTMSTTLDLNGGSIKDLTGNALPVSLTSPNLTGVLVNGVNPFVTNATIPAAGGYSVGQNLDFKLRFSEAVTVTGTPAIPLDVGGITKAANYLSGSGTNSLTFRYTVGGLDEDSDGVTHTQILSMSAGNMIVDSLGNPALPNFVSALLSGVIVTPGAPVITNFVWTDGTYLAGQSADVSVTFNKSVVVTGTPRLKLNVDGATRYANYLSGSGTTTLIFRHGIVIGDVDGDGVEITPPLELNGGTIKDAQGVTSSLSFTAPASPALLVEASIPSISSVTVPANGNYTTGQNLDFTLIFSESVDVVNPTFVKLKVLIGSSEREATYLSGSGSTDLLFRYTVVSQDLDEDGLQLVTPLSVTGTGLVRDLAGNAATYAFMPPSTAGVKVNYLLTNITAMSPPASRTYTTGEDMDFIAAFSHPVNVIGTPRIALTVGSTTRYADYLSGTGSTNLVFRHVVVASDQDNDGVTLWSPVELNGATIKNSLGNNAVLSFTLPNTTGVKVDGGVPSISFVTPPSGGTYLAGQNWSFTVALSESGIVSGTPRLALNVGGITRYANYQSGSGTTNLTFLYTTQPGDNDQDGIELNTPLGLNGGTLKNASAVNFDLVFTPPTTSALRVDTTAPTVSIVTPPASQTYGAGSNLDFQVTFSEAVTVNGTPRIALDVGGATKYAQYLSGTGSPNLIFRYQVQVGESDSNGVTLSPPITLNGGAIEDLPGNPATLTFTSPDTSGVVVGAVAPTITGLTLPAPSSYPAGAQLDFAVSFDAEVVVTGLPRIPLTIGATSKNANYLSGTGSNTLTFRYTVAAPDTDTDGISMPTAIQLNGGTIKDVYNNVATLSYPAQNTSLVLVDTTAPLIAGLTSPGNGVYLQNQAVDFVVNFNENVIVTGVPRIALTVGASVVHANYLSGSGTQDLLFRYVVAPGAVDSDGILMASSIDLNGGTIKDLATNPPPNLSLSPPNLSGVTVDGVLPTITNVSAPVNGVYQDGDSLTFTVTYNKPVTASGTLRIPLLMGSALAYANLSGGSGSSVLTFSYGVGASDLDLDGVSFAGAGIDLNGGSLVDGSAQNASLNYGTAPDLSKVFVVYPSFQHWYDLDDPALVDTTFDGSGDAVNSVADLMGNSGLTATGAQRPYYVPSGFGTGNSGHLQFFGSNVLNFVATPTFSSAIIVFKSHSDTGVTNSLLTMTTGPANDRMSIELDSSGNLNLNTVGDYKVNSGSFSLSPAATHAWSWSASTDYLLLLQWSAATTQTTELGSGPFNGQIAAIILIDDTAAPLSEAQFNAIRDALNTKFGVY